MTGFLPLEPPPRYDVLTSRSARPVSPRVVPPHGPMGSTARGRKGAGAMPLVHPDRRSAGFTLIELLVVIPIMGALLTLGVPALANFTQRSKIEGVARQTVNLMQVARFDSIKHSLPARVVVDYAADEVYAFTDMNPDDGPVYVPNVDRELGRFGLPNGIFFRAAEDGAPEEAGALDAFDEGNDCGGGCPAGAWEELRSDASAAELGAIRFGDKRDNYLEVRVVTAPTG